ncbi:MAG: subtilin biosynthesis sensor protein SpaK [Lachnospiraceae bacterium]|nr:subtilin biosynthesis sensor protein SpaK [Lachnospiraceae bacterium]
MAYTVQNELEHFGYNEAVIDGMRVMLENFYLNLQNVLIHPENSMNRDIRDMRTNGFELKIADAKIESFIEEGYKIYDPNGNLSEQVEDKAIEGDDMYKAMEELKGCTIYSIEKKDDIYTISIDTEDHTYLIKVKGASDEEHWDRFLSTAQML